MANDQGEELQRTGKLLPKLIPHGRWLGTEGATSTPCALADGLGHLSRDPLGGEGGPALSVSKSGLKASAVGLTQIQ